MAVITIPYQFKNGLPESGDIVIDTTNGPLCGEKYFELRPTKVSEIQTGGSTVQCTYFRYDGIEYGVYTKTPSEFIDLSIQCFPCDGGDCNCNEQETTFDWEMTAHESDSYLSTTIVKPVGSGDFLYQLILEVDSVVYASSVTVWNDALTVDPASQVTKDYIDAIIALIESYNIPNFNSGWNKAVNGMADNKNGVGMLELFFEVGATINQFVIEANAVSYGTISANGQKYDYAEIEFTDNSTVNVSDNIVEYTWGVWDGENMMVSTDGDNPTTPVWNLQSCGYLNPNNGWVMTEVISTTNGCVSNNTATAIINSTDILDCITNGTTKTGTGV